jgi:hypothetical protein
MSIKTHPCDLLTMTAERAWGNIVAANDLAARAPKGFHRNQWLEIGKRSTDVWLERIDERCLALASVSPEFRCFFKRHDLDHTAKGKVI